MTQEYRIGIVGLGYVGLPLAVAFAQKYPVVGFDINGERVAELKRGHDRTMEVSAEELAEVEDRLVLTSELAPLEQCNLYIITVPTPIDDTNRPDLTPLVNSSESIGRVLHKGDIVVYESTVYPGVTEEICVPVLEKSSGLVFNRDFFVGYSPERINPGDKKHTLKTIRKVTSGSTPEVAKTVDALYASIIEAGTCPVSSIKVAEASKVIENTQRDVNIALINELALIFDAMGIDTHEVIEAAATKWNFIKLKPGLVGGHCIGVDPYYLTFRAEELGYKPNLILGARQINNGMGKYIAEQTVKQLILHDKKVKGSRVLILGVTFKENCPDTRNTRVIDIVEGLKEYGIVVDAFDPWVDPGEPRRSFPHPLLEKDPFRAEKRYDAIVVAVAHDQFRALSDRDY